MKQTHPTYRSSDVIQQFQHGQLPPDKRKKVVEWLQGLPPEQAEQFLQEFGDQLDQLPEASFQQFLDQLTHTATQRPSTKKASPRVVSIAAYRTFLRAAAAITIVGIVGWVMYQYVAQDKSTPDQVLTVAEGTTQAITLSDGTIITLRGNSSLTYPERFGKQSRNVTLEGEAHFAVASETTRPFMVHAQSLTTQVLGTQFTIRTQKADSTVEVSLIEGKVKVITEANQQEVLAPLQQLVYHTGRKSLAIHPFNPDVVMAWQQATLVIDQEPLSQVVAKLSRRFNVDIQIMDEAIQQCRISIVIRKESLPTILKLLQHSFDITNRTETKQIKLYGNGCE